MPFDDDDVKKVLIALLGAVGGAAILQRHHDEKRKSQAERNDPEGTEWICGIVWDLLDDWHPPDYDREDDYTEDLFRFLRSEIGEALEEDDPDVSLEMRTATLHGIPDILIHDRLVLEVKVASKKTERDRLVGQCCEYSRGYVTWAIVIDWPDNRVDKLVDLLEAKSLNYIEVVPFDMYEDEDEFEDEDEE
jgi:hypothetical protein